MAIPKRPAGICALASGGVDSCALVADLLRRGREVHPLYVRCGYLWERAELHALRRYLRALRSPRLKTLTVVEAPMRGLVPANHWALTGRGTPPAGAAWTDVYLPGRNLALITTAALFCSARGIATLALALLKGNPFSDAGPRFRRGLSQVLRLSMRGAQRVTAPYSRLTKEQVLRRAPGAPLHLSLSCLRPRGLRPCGSCSKCAERELALAAPRKKTG